MSRTGPLFNPDRRNELTRLLLVPAGLLLLGTFSGCGSNATADRLPVHPVEGVVQYGTEKLDGAFLVLHPVPGSDPKVIPARGSVGAEGKFSVTTYEANDGAVAGDFIVTVVRTPLIERDGDQVAGPNVLPAKYAKPTTSDIKVTIVEGTNQLSPISLK
jgi:hypothetical protein